MRIVNLARSPFQNLRPLWRLTALLWIIGGFLLLLNLWLYWDHLTGFSETRVQLAEVRNAIESENAALIDLERRITAVELDEQNETVELLNRLIAQRTFPWGLLFDRLESVLPSDLRLESVQPESQELKPRRRTGRDRRRAAREEQEDSKVELSLTGTARNDEMINSLIDAMFEDPTFLNPTLRSERRNERGETDFSLSVEFLTEKAQELARPETVPEEPAIVLPPAPTSAAAPVGMGASATARLRSGGRR